MATVILIRLTLFITPPAHWLLGLSKVRFIPFLIGTAIGFIPGMALLTYTVVFFGESMGDWIVDRPPGFFAGVALVVIVFIRLRRTLAKRRERAPRSDAKDHIPAA